MGRGVDQLSYATGVTYFDVSGQGYETGWGVWSCPECEDNDYTGSEDDSGFCNSNGCKEVAMEFTENTEYDQDRGREEWDDFKTNIVEALQAKYPSLEKASGWDGETSIILENTFCEIGIAEYCGCASLSIRPKESDGYSDDNVISLAGAWTEKAWTGMLKAIDKEMPWANRLRKLGTFSNGESVFERVA